MAPREGDSNFYILYILLIVLVKFLLFCLSPVYDTNSIENVFYLFIKINDPCYNFYNNTLYYTMANSVKESVTIEVKKDSYCIRKAGFSFASICDAILPHLQFLQQWSPWQRNSVL